MSRWLFVKTSFFATVIAFEIGCILVRILPRRWIFAFCDALANVGFVLFRGYRTRSIASLSVALPEISAAHARVIAQRSLRNFFRSCFEMVVALALSDPERRTLIPLMGGEHLDAALAKGKGVIVLSAHLGNFFLLGTRLALDGHSIHILINQPGDGYFARLMDNYRLHIRLSTIHARPRQQALRALDAVLKQGGIVIMIADEYRKNGTPAKLFGRTVLARRGPVAFATRTGAAVVPACIVRQPDDRLLLVVEPELGLARSRKGQVETTENVLRMTQWLEKTVRAHPDQWNWMNFRWWPDLPTNDGKTTG
jgi:KDO2-lipid IV(A) lauroyltransferase